MSMMMGSEDLPWSIPPCRVCGVLVGGDLPQFVYSRYALSDHMGRNSTDLRTPLHNLSGVQNSINDLYIASAAAELRESLLRTYSL
jgi:hypothetical protein